MKQRLTEVREWGNSGGILVPKEWVGKQVKIILLERTNDVKREVLKILEPYLEDIIGIYLVGSYARKEEHPTSDIDILVISKGIKKSFMSGKYEIEIITLKDVVALLKTYPIVIYPKFIDAKPILNKSLLEEMRQIKIKHDSLDLYLENCRKILKINKKLLKEDKSEGEFLKSYAIIYSVLLRLKALYIMDSILTNKKYTNKAFEDYLFSSLKIKAKQLEELYEVYENVLHNKRTKEKIPISLAESLINLLEKEILKYGEKKKKT